MVYLQFQELAIKIPLRLRSFYENIDKMSLLLSGKNIEGDVVDVKRELITIKQLFYERIHNTNKHDRTLLRGHGIDTGVVMINDPDNSGETIIGLYSNPVVKELIHSINPKSSINKGSLQVNMEQYQTIKKDAFILKPDIANALRKDPYSNQEIREGLWDYVTKGDTELVKDNLSFVQETNGGNMSNRMGWHLSSDPGLRLVRVGGVELEYSNCGYNLNLDNVHLVGKIEKPFTFKDLESQVRQSDLIS